MCGITGIFDPDRRPDPGTVQAMTEQLVHRGPDGDGFFSDEHIAVGMRRLAIMDPAHGHQPLYDEHRRVVVVFNGEIYNQLELREWLHRRGHELASGSDGAVLPHLYE